MAIITSRFFAVSCVLWALTGCSEFVDRVPADTGAEVAGDTGGTTACVGVSCDDSDPCTSDRCEPTTGACVHAPKPDGATCDDGRFCTASDACVSGACVGTPTDCPDDLATCRVGQCDDTAGACALVAADDGTPCDDGNSCTTSDACTSGLCEGGAPIDCAGPTEACRVATCTPQDGCTTVAAMDDAVCDDGDPCTGSDRCAAGACGGVATDCSDLNEACREGLCDPLTGQCVRRDLDLVPCDDGMACTLEDACDDGLCKGAAKTCTSLDTSCTEGVCDATSGQCVAKAVAAGQPCDDGDLCSTASACAGGVCEATAQRDCHSADTACAQGVCLPSTGLCAAIPRDDGITCSDDNACTDGDACLAGKCEGLPKNCSGDAPACYSSKCLPDTGACASIPDPGLDGTACDDNLYCTVDGYCQSGVCQLSLRDCSDLAASCEQATCDEAAQKCVVATAPDGTACSDGKGCTTVDLCTGGVCAGTSALDCSALTGPCTTGLCSDAAGGCVSVNTADGTPCSDAKVCTSADACQSGECVGTPLDCSSLTTDCRVGACSESASGCTTVSVPDGSFCTDGVACTIGDGCKAGVCTPGTPVDCPCDHPATGLSLGGGCVTAPGRPLIDGTPTVGFTVEFWLRTTSTASARLLDQRISASQGESDWSISYEAPGGKGQLRFLYGNTGGTDSQIGMAGVTLNDGAWHHVALVRDGMDVRWWIDGAGLAVSNTANMLTLQNSSDLAIGCGRFGGENFTGDLDELTIYSYPRYRSAFIPAGRHDLTLGVTALYRFDDVAAPIDTVTGLAAVESGTVARTTDVVAPASTCCGDTFIEAGEACEMPGVGVCSAACEATATVAQSAVFDGATSCIEVSGAPLLAVVSTMTVEFWIQTKATNVIVLDKRTAAGSDPAGWTVTLDATGRPTFTGGTTGTTAAVAVAASGIADGSWHHVAFLHFAGNKIKWFIDGVPATSITLDTLEPLGNTAVFRVGCGLDGVRFAGRIDGLRISRTTRYATSFVPKTTFMPDLDAELLYSFDIPVIGGLVRDLSPGLHDGAATSGVSVTAGAP